MSKLIYPSPIDRTKISEGGWSCEIEVYPSGNAIETLGKNGVVIEQTWFSSSNIAPHTLTQYAKLRLDTVRAEHE